MPGTITSLLSGEPDLEFDHIGLACRDLDREAAWLGLLGYAALGTDFEDPLQGVRGRFLEGPGPRLELLADIRPGGPVGDWLAGGTKLYHLAFLTGDLERSIARLRERRARLVAPPRPAAAFGLRHIAFLMLPSMLLVELIAKE